MQQSAVEAQIDEEQKPKVVALPVWLGSRFYDESDLEAFIDEFSWHREFASYNIQTLTEVEIRQHNNKSYLCGVKALLQVVKQILESADTKVVVFYIVTAGIAESHWFTIFKKLVKKHNPDQPDYTIIVGSNFSTKRDEDKESPYNWSDRMAHRLGAVHSFFNSDAPTAGMRRLMEMINRIMGADLPNQEFPDYSEDDLRKLAWHVCQEGFNAFGNKTGALPKYKIGENGRPIFNVKKRKGHR